MSIKEGKLLKCDAKSCAAFTFIKKIGKKIVDGECTRIDSYEDAPPGWAIYNGLGCLCPDCSLRFTTYIKNLFGDDVAPVWKYNDGKKEN